MELMNIMFLGDECSGIWQCATDLRDLKLGKPLELLWIGVLLTIGARIVPPVT